MMRFVLLSGLVLLMACNKSISENTAGTGSIATTAATLADINYGTDARQKMDIYLPAKRSTTSTKVIFLIHGGAWNEGDKADFNAYVALLQQNLTDYAIVNINYRLALNSQNLFPTQENDVKAAAEQLYSKRNEYQVSDKWVFLGASAGGQLALLQSYKYTSPVRPKAVISFFGPTDLTTLYQSNPLIGQALQLVTGTTPQLNAALYQQSSPINYVSAQSPPTLLLQGGMDPLVAPVQSTTLRDKLQGLGVVNQYVFYPTEGHGWTDDNLTDSFNKIFAFLRQYVP